MYPTIPTIIIGGVSIIVTASTTSFLLISKKLGFIIILRAVRNALSTDQLNQTIKKWLIHCFGEEEGSSSTTGQKFLNSSRGKVPSVFIHGERPKTNEL